jgi:cytochrome P450
MYARLRDEAPVHHVADHDYWVLSRFADVWSAARDTETFSSAQGLTIHRDELSKIGLDTSARPIVMMDPPEHTAFRRLVAAGFTPRQVTAVEPVIRTFVRARLDRITDHDEVDIVAELFKPLPSLVVAHYLGVPDVDRDRFDRWSEAIVEANATGDPTAAPAALADLIGYFGELIDRRRHDRGEDAISQLVGDTPEQDRADILRILGFGFTMVAGGNDTTTGLLGHSAEVLTAQRDQRALLIADPTSIGDAVEELLRLASPVQGLARTTTRSVTIGNRTIPAGVKVLLLYASGNRDPREFGDDAAECDVLRSPRRILSFSYGAHHCLGAAAARTAGRVALEELLARFPEFEVDAERGVFAEGNYVRRYRSLPFAPQGF